MPRLPLGGRLVPTERLWGWGWGTLGPVLVSAVLTKGAFRKASAGGTVVKTPPANAGDAGWIPGSGRSPGGGNGNPLQYSSLGNPVDRGAWRATV